MLFRSRADDIMQKSGLSENGCIELARTGENLNLIETILKWGLEKTEFSQQICSSYLKALLLEQAAIPQTDKTTPQALITYRKCRAYIDRSFSSIVTPSQAANACDVNIRYMSRLFKKYGSITPGQYVMRLKLNKSAGLLLTSKLTIADIACLVGFDDPYHFSRNFKAFHGVSPLK